MRKATLFITLLLCFVSCTVGAQYADWRADLFGKHPLYFQTMPVFVSAPIFPYFRSFQSAPVARIFEHWHYFDGLPSPVASCVATVVGSGLANGTAHFLRGGSLGADGRVYWPPNNSGYWVIYDPVTNTAITTTFGLSWPSGYCHGSVTALNGKIYTIPLTATTIGIVDTTGSTPTAIQSTLGASLSGTNKYVGGVLAPDGKIYCAPYDAANVLVIDPDSNTATTTTFGISWAGATKYYGAAISGSIVTFVPYSGPFAFIDTESGIATRTTVAGIEGAPYWSICSLPNGYVFCLKNVVGSHSAFVNPATRSGFNAFATPWLNAVGGCIVGEDGLIYLSGYDGDTRRIDSAGASRGAISWPSKPCLIGTLVNAGGGVLVGLSSVPSYAGITGVIRYDTKAQLGARSYTATTPFFNKGN